MPSSEPRLIPPVMAQLMNIRPNTVLDLGVGFGKWGFLIREYLETWQGRYKRDQFKLTLDGVEIFPDYIGGHQEAIYDCIVNEDIRKVSDLYQDTKILQSYDVVMAMDVLEHLPKADAADMIKQMIKMSKRAAIMSIPLGQAWLAANSSYLEINPAEKHLSAWNESEVWTAAGMKPVWYDEVPAARGPIGIFQFGGG